MEGRNNVDVKGIEYSHPLPSLTIPEPGRERETRIRYYTLRDLRCDYEANRLEIYKKRFSNK